MDKACAKKDELFAKNVSLSCADESSDLEVDSIGSISDYIIVYAKIDLVNKNIATKKGKLEVDVDFYNSTITDLFLQKDISQIVQSFLHLRLK